MEPTSPTHPQSMTQRRWMPVFKYLVQVSWKRFLLLWLLGALVTGFLSELIQFAGIDNGSGLTFPLYIIATAAMIAARLVLSDNPQYMPADKAPAAPALADVPAPNGQLAYAGWLLARLSWLSFIALCMLLAVLGSFLASLVKAPTTEVTHDARPVRVIVRDSTQKDMTGKDAEILIDDNGIHFSKSKSIAAPPVPPVPPASPATPAPPAPPAASVDLTKSVVVQSDNGDATLSVGKDGVRIEKLENGKKKVVVINGKGVEIRGGEDAPIRDGKDAKDQYDKEQAAAAEAAKNKQKTPSIDIDQKMMEAEVKLKEAEAALKRIDSDNANGASSGVSSGVSKEELQQIKREVQEAVVQAKREVQQEVKDVANAARAQAEAAKAQAEEAKAQAEADAVETEANVQAAFEAAKNAQVVTIDMGKKDPAQVAKAVRDALLKARGTIEEDVRASIESEQAQEFQLPWGKLIKALTVVLLLMLTALKIMANAQYAARASAMRATQRAEGETLKRQLSDAQLKAMQAQVEPHFLFNTLASVDYLIETAPAQASKMQKSLISYLRAALPQMRQASTTLGREAKLITSYLDIMKVRMEERLTPTVIVPETLYSAEFPPMMLQSLVENSIKHGLEPKPEGGEIKVSAYQQGDKLVIEVSDTGVGLSEKGVRAPTSGTGIGINNIRERLQMLYGNRASFTLSPNMVNGVSEGTIARVELPYEVLRTMT